VVHFPVSREVVDSILSYYETHRGFRFNFLYHGNLKVYECGFLEQPQEIWTAPGLDGSGVWKVTSLLSGNEVV